MSSIVGRTITRGPVEPPALWDGPDLDGAAVVPATAATDLDVSRVFVFFPFFFNDIAHDDATSIACRLCL